MMITIDSNFLFLALACNAVLLGIASFSIIRFVHRCRRLEEFWASPTGTVLAGDKDDDGREQLRVTQRLEERLGQLQRTVKVMEIKSPPARAIEKPNLPIENAIRMAKLGASIEDLTKSCGLNVGEARLMRKLHGQVMSTSNRTH